MVTRSLAAPMESQSFSLHGNHGIVIVGESGPLVSFREAARRLGISKQAVLRAVKEGRLASEEVQQRRWLVPETALADYKVQLHRVAAGKFGGRPKAKAQAPAKSPPEPRARARRG